MPLDNDRYVCALCGTHVDLDRRVVPTYAFEGPNAHPRWRIVTANGREIHRCGVRYGDLPRITRTSLDAET